MAGTVTDYARASAAFAQPSLQLLGRKWAPVVVSLFMTSFIRGSAQTIPTDEFHERVHQHLDALNSAGHDVPDGSPAFLCRQWREQDWLERRYDQDAGGEVYALTSHSQDVIEFVNRHGGTRALLGQSRIQTVADALRRAATNASTSREERIDRLDAQIARLTEQRDALAAGEEILTPDEGILIEDYLNARDLINALPADFARVAESFKAIHHDLIDQFRTDDRPHGQIVTEYLSTCERLVEDSNEGRAFAGAVALLRDDVLMAELTGDIDSIVEALHEVLTGHERIELQHTVRMIRAGLTTVLRQRAQLSATVRSAIASHDAAAERALADALREAKAAFAARIATSTRVREAIHLDVDLSGADIGHLRQRVATQQESAAAPPLFRDQPDTEPVSLAQLRAAGGPRIADLEHEIAERLPHGPVTAAEVLSDAPEDLRRPVEIVGLIHLGADVGHIDPRPDIYEAIRPDGTRRSFTGPRVTFTQEKTLDDTREQEQHAWAT